MDFFSKTGAVGLSFGNDQTGAVGFRTLTVKNRTIAVCSNPGLCSFPAALQLYLKESRG